MTKLRHENPPHWGPDPGAVRSVPDTTRPSRWVSPQERRRKEAERVKERRELKERSEQHDWELMEAQLEGRIGEKKALGVPRLWIEKQVLKRRDERR